MRSCISFRVVRPNLGDGSVPFADGEFCILAPSSCLVSDRKRYLVVFRQDSHVTEFNLKLTWSLRLGRLGHQIPELNISAACKLMGI